MATTAAEARAKVLVLSPIPFSRPSIGGKRQQLAEVQHICKHSTCALGALDFCESCDTMQSLGVIRGLLQHLRPHCMQPFTKQSKHNNSVKTLSSYIFKFAGTQARGDGTNFINAVTLATNDDELNGCHIVVKAGRCSSQSTPAGGVLSRARCSDGTREEAQVHQIPGRSSCTHTSCVMGRHICVTSKELLKLQLY